MPMAALRVAAQHAGLLTTQMHHAVQGETPTECPLCCSALDQTERSYRPCPCGCVLSPSQCRKALPRVQDLRQLPGTHSFSPCCAVQVSSVPILPLKAQR